MSGDVRELRDPYRCRVQLHCVSIDHDCQILHIRLIVFDQDQGRAVDPVPSEKMPCPGILMICYK